MKYIRHKTKGFFLFPNVQHSQIDHLFMGTWLGIKDIVSAGFIGFGSDGLPQCYGSSISLNIGCGVLDTEMLRKEMGFN